MLSHTWSTPPRSSRELPSENSSQGEIKVSAPFHFPTAQHLCAMVLIRATESALPAPAVLPGALEVHACVSALMQPSSEDRQDPSPPRSKPRLSKSTSMAEPRMGEIAGSRRNLHSLSSAHIGAGGGLARSVSCAALDGFRGSAVSESVARILATNMKRNTTLERPPTPQATRRTVRVLCLHGAMMTKDILELSLGPLHVAALRLGSQLRIELICVNGPHATALTQGEYMPSVFGPSNLYRTTDADYSGRVSCWRKRGTRKDGERHRDLIAVAHCDGHGALRHTACASHRTQPPMPASSPPPPPNTHSPTRARA